MKVKLSNLKFPEGINTFGLNILFPGLSLVIVTLALGKRFISLSIGRDLKIAPTPAKKKKGKKK